MDDWEVKKGNCQIDVRVTVVKCEDWKASSVAGFHLMSSHGQCTFPLLPGIPGLRQCGSADRQEQLNSHSERLPAKYPQIFQTQ